MAAERCARKRLEPTDPPAGVDNVLEAMLEILGDLQRFVATSGLAQRRTESGPEELRTVSSPAGKEVAELQAALQANLGTDEEGAELLHPVPGLDSSRPHASGCGHVAGTTPWAHQFSERFFVPL